MEGTITFNVETAQRLVNDVIAEKGEDFKYERQAGYDCLYVHENKSWDADIEEYVTDESGLTPGCVWGHALAKAGVPLDKFEDVEGDSIESAVERLHDQGYIGEVDDLAKAWAYHVQHQQDSGRTWGVAVKRANSILNDTSLSDEERADKLRNV